MRQIKAGGKHLLTKKSPRKKATLGVKAKVASKSVVKKYKQIISASSK
ncbi:MAG TPA: hypothetical protein PK957_04215 [Candidatus Dojkabacteria bacterium]|nr:hypothetical protein [Candidatus Dojkabacteria bacterium]HQF36223.1 hypothetical protein [Candidatus Dojkabacteria bacterium]